MTVYSQSRIARFASWGRGKGIKHKKRERERERERSPGKEREDVRARSALTLPRDAEGETRARRGFATANMPIVVEDCVGWSE